MTIGTFMIFKLLFIVVLLGGWAVWELRQLRRDKPQQPPPSADHDEPTVTR